MEKFVPLPPIEEPAPPPPPPPLSVQSNLPVTVTKTIRAGMDKTRTNCQGKNLEGQPCSLQAALRRNGEDLTWFWGCTGYPNRCRATRDLTEQEVGQYLQNAITVSAGPEMIQVSIDCRSPPGKGGTGKGKGPEGPTQTTSLPPMAEVEDPYESWWYTYPVDGPKQPKGKGKTMTKGNVCWRKEN